MHLLWNPSTSTHITMLKRSMYRYTLHTCISLNKYTTNFVELWWSLEQSYGYTNTTTAIMWPSAFEWYRNRVFIHQYAFLECHPPLPFKHRIITLTGSTMFTRADESSTKLSLLCWGSQWYNFCSFLVSCSRFQSTPNLQLYCSPISLNNWPQNSLSKPLHHRNTLPAISQSISWRHSYLVSKVVCLADDMSHRLCGA